MQRTNQTGAALGMKRVSALAVGLAAMLVIAASRPLARDSSTSSAPRRSIPFSTTVTEALAKQGVLKSPVVEATGTGGGIKLFCEGVGEATPDIVGASRKIKDSEIDDLRPERRRQDHRDPDRP